MDDWRELDLANPTEEHAMLRQMVRDFVADEVEPQALEHDRNERCNAALFRRLGSRESSGFQFLLSTAEPEWMQLRLR